MRKPQKNTRQQAGAAIHVVQPHTLGVEEAIARLSKGDRPSLVGVLQWIVGTPRLTEVTARFVVELPGTKVKGTVFIGADRVTVESEPVGRLVEWIGESTIKSKLAEALK